jgi:drug/metabolite transporter (DMT)-like permease
MGLSLVVSLLFLLPIHYFARGELFPFGATFDRWLILGLSSIAGYVISALLLLRSFQRIGPRLTMLVGSTSPICAAVLSWIFLRQALPVYVAAGIALVLAGVIWVVSENAGASLVEENANYQEGLLTALAAAATQGASFTLMSAGVADGYHAISASLIRTVVGVAILALFICLRGSWGRRLKPVIAEPSVGIFLVLASLAGPVLGTTFVLLSLQFTSVGVSSTLTNTTPIVLIPIGYLVFGEKITYRAVVGTGVAIAGVAVLFAG